MICCNINLSVLHILNVGENSYVCIIELSLVKKIPFVICWNQQFQIKVVDLEITNWDLKNT